MALETVWQQEQQAHLHEAAFSNDPERRLECRGVVRWLAEVLSGALMAKHAYKAKAALHLHDPDEGLPESGSPWMESDEVGP